MQTKLLVFILVFLSVTAANALQIQEIDNPNWLSWIKPSPSVFTEMNKYFKKEDRSNDASEYIQEFVPAMHEMMVTETHNFLNGKVNQSACNSTVEVSFPKQLTSNHAFDSIDDFESNFIKVETYACLGKLNIDKVFQTLISKEFQVEVIEGIKSISFPSEHRVCVKTESFFVDTDYCVSKQVAKTKTQYIIHSYNDENKAGSDPFYFKETINVITQLPNGEVSYYNLMYARNKDLAFTGKIRSKTEDMQEKFSQVLSLRAR